jgi:hypothetical protein
MYGCMAKKAGVYEKIPDSSLRKENLKAFKLQLTLPYGLLSSLLLGLYVVKHTP